MIEIKDLNYVFQKGSVHENRAISGINLTIEKGEFIILIGANGSGKSTLLNLLAGSRIPDAGKILFNGKDISRLSEHARSVWISRIFQNPMLGTADELSILENLRLASLRTGRKKLKIGTGTDFRTRAVAELKKIRLGLEKNPDQIAGTLSGGQRQALTLLMAVLDDSEILLMDEPTAALDPKTTELFMDLTREITAERNLTVILVTHHLKDALKYGTRLIQLENGRLRRDLKGREKAGLTFEQLFSWF